MDAIGSSTKPIYIGADGIAKPITGPIGSASKPVYVNANGEIVEGNAPIYNNPHATASVAGILKTTVNASFVGTDANGDLIAVTLPDTDCGIGPNSLGDYTEVVPYWEYSTPEGDIVNPSKGETVICPEPYQNVTCFRVNGSDDEYQYTVSIPTWSTGKTKMLSVDFCCQGDSESLADMRVWLISGTKEVNILKQHSFNYGYDSSGAVAHSNAYASCNLIIPIKSGVNLRFVSSKMVRHMHILLFNV